MNVDGFQRFKLGSLGNRGRFIAPIDQQFLISFINIDPREAKCCLPLHETNTHYSNFEFKHIDPNNKNEKLCFKSLVAIRNIHSVLEGIKILHCVKCNRTCPGFEDDNEIFLKVNGKQQILSAANDPELFTTIKKSEVIDSTDMRLCNRFKNTDVYTSDGFINISSICTKCEKYYNIDNNIVVPIPPAEEFSSQSTLSQSSQESTEQTLQYNQINKWSAENLFTLNLLNEHDFETYMKSLTKAELMCISPLLINIEIVRCRGTQVPFSQHGSIAFPLKTPMESGSLPWYDFHNLPLIIVYVHHVNEKYRKEAKVNLLYELLSG